MFRIFLSRLVGPSESADCETFVCPVADCKYGKHERVWVISRVLADTFGHFPVFRINGDETPVDGSLPHRVVTLPRDARDVGPWEAHAFWCDESGSHVFGW